MKMTNPNPSPIGLGFGFVLFGTDVHKGFNKHTGTYNHISKSTHFLIILFCGTKYLQKVRDEKTGEILRYLPFFGI